MSMDSQDGNIDGLENLSVEEVAAADHPYTEATADTLATEELLYDGVDTINLLPQDEETPVDEFLHNDDVPHDDTIEDRLAQEEPDPSSQVVHGDPLDGSETPTDPRADND